VTGIFFFSLLAFCSNVYYSYERVRFDMAKSTIITLRLNDVEIEALDAVTRSDLRGNLTRSETIRLLVLREWKRRSTGRSRVSSNEYMSDVRMGRPCKVV